MKKLLFLLLSLISIHRLSVSNGKFLSSASSIFAIFMSCMAADIPDLSIVIPAYNEQDRIGGMLNDYCTYFQDRPVSFIVVLNGITDNTKEVVQQKQLEYPNKINMIESAKGKGNAIKVGFLKALENPNNTYIGFVDADGAIAPDQYDKIFNTLLKNKEYGCNGIIASRYMEGSDIGVKRPLIKEWGRRIWYNRPIKKALQLDFCDYQCGAKIFTRNVIEKIAPMLEETSWAIDLEILYLTHIFNFRITEEPIVWRDQAGSHLDVWGSISDLGGAPKRIKNRFADLTKKETKSKAKQNSKKDEDCF